MKNAIEHARNGGVRGVCWWLSKLWHRRISSSLSGESVWSRDWELLVILDACRPEWLRPHVGSEPLEDASFDTLPSIGATSEEWYANTFAGDVPEDVAVVTANLFARDQMRTRPATADYVSEWGWDEDLGTVPAHTVTDAAIRCARDAEYDRLVVHYMQPHVPFVQRGASRKDVDLRYEWTLPWDLWWAMMRGEIDRESVERAFERNLEYVLGEVEILLSNVDAETAVVSADHANCLGESWMWGHPGGVEMAELKTVPWVETTARDHGTHSPTVRENTTQEVSREEQLQALGYR